MVHDKVDFWIYFRNNIQRIENKTTLLNCTFLNKTKLYIAKHN